MTLSELETNDEPDFLKVCRRNTKNKRDFEEAFKALENLIDENGYRSEGVFPCNLNDADYVLLLLEEDRKTVHFFCFTKKQKHQMKSFVKGIDADQETPFKVFRIFNFKQLKDKDFQRDARGILFLDLL